MKKFSFWIALALSLMLLTSPVLAESITDLLTGLGATEQSIQTLQAVLAEIGETVTEDELGAMLDQFLGDASGAAGGSMEDGVFTHPLGFSFPVPEGWSQLPEQLGMAALLTGPLDAQGFAPTIGVIVLGEARTDFDNFVQEDLDALLSETLPNYYFLALDSFTFLDVPAHEFVLMHGEDENALLMQYQLFFNKDDLAFIITLTTLAEEAAHDDALEAYDALLAGFDVFAGEGNG